MTADLLAERLPRPHPRDSAEDRRRYDDYLASRTRYREEFLDELCGVVRAAGAGPVLEAGLGYGGLGRALLDRVEVSAVWACESAEAAELCRRRWVDGRPGPRPTLLVAPDGIPGRDAGPYPVVYSVSCLHTWADPVAALRRLHRLLAPGGVLLVNDLRRDGDPFITEYVLRELAEDRTETGAYRLRTFLESLSSAYTVAELTAIAEASGLPRWDVGVDGAMAVTVRAWKG